jgi:hypothetical protein
MKYDDVIVKCKEAFLGTKNLMVEHYKFNTRNQKQGESSMDFAIELQSLAGSCEFGYFRVTALRDRFVAGILNSGIKVKVLSLGSNATFKSVVDEAVKEEMVAKDVWTMLVPGELARVVRESGLRSRSRHNYQNRSRSAKRFSPSKRNDIRCYNCQGFGHVANRCSSNKKKSGDANAQRGRGRSQTSVQNQLELLDNPSDGNINILS